MPRADMPRADIRHPTALSMAPAETPLVKVTDALGRLVDLPARSGDGADPDSGRSHFPARFTENVAAAPQGDDFREPRTFP